LQSSVPTLLQRQADKLDFLIQRVAVLDKARESNSTRQSSTADAIFSASKVVLPLFRSPTSSFFSISILDVHLKGLEVQVDGQLLGPDNCASPLGNSFFIVQDGIIEGKSGETVGLESDDAETSPIGTIHPLDDLDGEEIIRLVHVYQETVGFMYPILDTTRLKQKVEEILGVLAMSRNKRRDVDWRRTAIDGNDVAILKMVVAISLTVEGEECSELALRLYRSLQQDVDAIVWNTKIDLKGLILLSLVVPHPHPPRHLDGLS
jgi:hypothetical protein